MIFFQKPNYVSCDRQGEILIVTWTDFGDDKLVQESCLSQLEQVKLGAKIVLIDTSQAKGVISPQTNSWFMENLFPQMEKAGLKAIVTVLSKEDAIIRLASRQWKRAGSGFGFDMYDVGEFAAARSLAQDILNGTVGS